MPKVLVTGGCGFIGSNLVKLLNESGHIVTIVDNFSRGKTEYLDNVDKYTVICADIRDQDALIEAMKEHDAVIHLAAYGSVVESVEEPTENFSINAEGTFKVLNAARISGVPQVVFASTGGALIGNATPPVNEKSLPRPISPYGASKLVGEGYCSAFASSYGMSITALRFANVIGPISWHKKGAVTAFYKAIMNNLAIEIYGDGSATRDFLYVADLCKGIMAALEKKKSGYNVYHLAGGCETSVKELAELACEVANKSDYPIIFHPKRKGEVERNFAYYDLAAEELGFKPQVSLKQAMKDTWEWMKKQA